MDDVGLLHYAPHGTSLHYCVPGFDDDDSLVWDDDNCATGPWQPTPTLVLLTGKLTEVIW